MGLLDLATFKVRLKIDGADQDAAITKMLAAAEKLTAFKLLGRKRIVCADEKDLIAETQSGNRSPVIYTNEYPIIELASLKIDGADIPERKELAAAGWYLEFPDFGRIDLVGYRATKWKGNIDLSYRAGWLDGEVPEDIIEAAYCIATALYNHSEHIGLDQVAFDSNAISIRLTDIMDPRSVPRLDHYRRPR